MGYSSTHVVPVPPLVPTPLVTRSRLDLSYSGPVSVPVPQLFTKTSPTRPRTGTVLE